MYVKVCTGMYICAQVCTGDLANSPQVSECVQVGRGMYRCVQVCTGVYRCVQMCTGVHVRTRVYRYYRCAQVCTGVYR